MHMPKSRESAWGRAVPVVVVEWTNHIDATLTDAFMHRILTGIITMRFCITNHPHRRKEGTAMSRTRRTKRIGRGDAQRITVRGVRRDPLDYRKLSRAILMLAQAQAEADAKAEAEVVAQANGVTRDGKHPRGAEASSSNTQPEGGSV